MFSLFKWHKQLINFLSPSFIGDIVGSLVDSGGGFFSPSTFLTGANLVSGLLGASSASDAANAQLQAANNATALQQMIWQTQQQQQAPYRTQGYNALNTIASMLPGQQYQYDQNGNLVVDANNQPVMTTGSGYLTHQFGSEDLNAALAPNYAFQLEQGQNATRNAANATGGLVGGNAMKALQDYTQNFAGNAYQNAFNNYQAQRGNIYNTLAGIAGLGQTATTQTGKAAQNYANAASELGVGGAAASAAGRIGATSALTGGLTNAANTYYLSQMLGQGSNPMMNTLAPSQNLDYYLSYNT